MIDTPVVAALDMYVEPDCVRQAGATFIGEVCRRLGVRRYAPAAADLAVQWRQPNLLFAQTCGYPLMTQLRGQVAVLAVPSYDLPGALPASIAVCSSPPKDRRASASATSAIPAWRSTTATPTAA